MKEIFLNHRNDKGQSIVHLACKNNCQDIVEKFLKKGVGFDCRDNDNKTPLELAIENNHSSIIEILQPKESPRTSPSIAGTNPRSSSPRQIS